MDQQEQSRWRSSRRQLLWAGGIAALAFLIIVICGYLFEWKWTGLTQSKVNKDVQPTKTMWDWLGLLIIPAVLAIGGYLFTRSENRATQAAAERRAQDEALQAYLDQMGQLLLDKDRPLRQSEEDSEVRMLARARTLTVLPRLDGDRKARVVQFLYESDLIAKGRPILDLSMANLSGASLRGANLRGADLKRANLSGADLSGAGLRGADLRGTDLSGADLRWADLGDADLFNASLPRADLSGANLFQVDLRRAGLKGANLFEADLSGAALQEAGLIDTNLRGAILSGAIVSGAILSGAVGWTTEKLEQQARSLEGATMPDGQKYEDWLKSKGRGEDGEDSSPS